MSNLILLAGPNGSGKTTFYNQVLGKKYPNYFYINADVIKKEITKNRVLDFTNTYGIRTDINEIETYLFKKFKLEIGVIGFTIMDYGKVIYNPNGYFIDDDYLYLAITQFILEKLVEQCANIIYETVFSHESKIDLIKSIKNKGYNIMLYYICTDYPLINVINVAKRVKEGGHNVPEDKIVSRYYRSLENLLKYMLLEDDSYFNNYTFINSDYNNNFTSPNNTFWLNNLYNKYYAVKPK